MKGVSPATRDAFPTSGLFRNCESGAQAVYGLEVTSEDVAVLHWINMSGSQAVSEDANFFAKVFCINNSEQALYPMGSNYTSLSQVPDYSRYGGGSTPTPTPRCRLRASNPNVEHRLHESLGPGITSQDRSFGRQSMLRSMQSMRFDQRRPAALQSADVWFAETDTGAQSQSLGTTSQA